MNRSLLKGNALFFEWAMRLLDPLLVGIVGGIVFRVYVDDWGQLTERYTLAILGMCLVCAALFPFLGLYSPQRGVSMFEELRRLFNAWLMMAGTWFAFLFLSKSGAEFSRVWSVYWIVIGFLAHLAARGGIRFALRALRRSPANVARLIRAKLDELADDPTVLRRNVKALRGRPGYRLRVGDWRVIFELDHEERRLIVLDIGPRGDVYER